MVRGADDSGTVGLEARR